MNPTAATWSPVKYFRVNGPGHDLRGISHPGPGPADDVVADGIDIARPGGGEVLHPRLPRVLQAFDHERRGA